jgi:hypothetical protein
MRLNCSFYRGYQYFVAMRLEEAEDRISRLNGFEEYYTDKEDAPKVK